MTSVNVHFNDVVLRRIIILSSDFYSCGCIIMLIWFVNAMYMMFEEETTLTIVDPVTGRSTSLRPLNNCLSAIINNSVRVFLPRAKTCPLPDTCFNIYAETWYFDYWSPRVTSVGRPNVLRRRVMSQCTAVDNIINRKKRAKTIVCCWVTLWPLSRVTRW